MQQKERDHFVIENHSKCGAIDRVVLTPEESQTIKDLIDKEIVHLKLLPNARSNEARINSLIELICKIDI